MLVIFIHVLEFLYILSYKKTCKVDFITHFTDEEAAVRVYGMVSSLYKLKIKIKAELSITVDKSVMCYENVIYMLLVFITSKAVKYF